MQVGHRGENEINLFYVVRHTKEFRKKHVHQERKIDVHATNNTHQGNKNPETGTFPADLPSPTTVGDDAT